eukprot:6175637-Pleurochrysis_carterae.AAC.1
MIRITTAASPQWTTTTTRTATRTTRTTMTTMRRICEDSALAGVGKKRQKVKVGNDGADDDTIHANPNYNTKVDVNTDRKNDMPASSS